MNKLVFKKVNNLSFAKEIYEISIDPVSRKFSKNTKKFSFSSHLKWLKKIISSKKNNIFLFKNEKKIIGFIILKKKIKFYYLSWAINPKLRGFSYGKKMLRSFIKKYPKKYIAEVKDNNYISKKLCLKCGFKFLKKRKKYNIYSTN